ncbi:hypothetical protein BESB_081850 [Besnoitia besnoiti]|uniref:Transmembrane protein n=1 Tax=Besnoitia besnoiti TaxID=94643 RepID=A0A2A9MAM1_BESBE|nr:hypothetical protein BESB_081850 [Besnoitia besnoiti]PFH32986.1 hypothetical protein BESB_081850 [Besnoitia besnoiti]
MPHSRRRQGAAGHVDPRPPGSAPGGRCRVTGKEAPENFPHGAYQLGFLHYHGDKRFRLRVRVAGALFAVLLALLGDGGGWRREPQTSCLGGGERRSPGLSPTPPAPAAHCGGVLAADVPPKDEQSSSSRREGERSDRDPDSAGGAADPRPRPPPEDGSPEKEGRSGEGTTGDADHGAAYKLSTDRAEAAKLTSLSTETPRSSPSLPFLPVHSRRWLRETELRRATAPDNKEEERRRGTTASQDLALSLESSTTFGDAKTRSQRYASSPFSLEQGVGALIGRSEDESNFLMSLDAETAGALQTTAQMIEMAQGGRERVARLATTKEVGAGDPRGPQPKAQQKKRKEDPEDPAKDGADAPQKKPSRLAAFLRRHKFTRGKKDVDASVKRAADASGRPEGDPRQAPAQSDAKKQTVDDAAPRTAAEDDEEEARTDKDPQAEAQGEADAENNKRWQLRHAGGKVGAWVRAAAARKGGQAAPRQFAPGYVRALRLKHRPLGADKGTSAELSAEDESLRQAESALTRAAAETDAEVESFLEQVRTIQPPARGLRRGLLLLAAALLVWPATRLGQWRSEELNDLGNHEEAAAGTLFFSLVLLGMKTLHMFFSNFSRQRRFEKTLSRVRVLYYRKRNIALAAAATALAQRRRKLQQRTAALHQAPGGERIPHPGVLRSKGAAQRLRNSRLAESNAEKPSTEEALAAQGGKVPEERQHGGVAERGLKQGAGAHLLEGATNAGVPLQVIVEEEEGDDAGGAAAVVRRGSVGVELSKPDEPKATENVREEAADKDAAGRVKSEEERAEKVHGGRGCRWLSRHFLSKTERGCKESTSREESPEDRKARTHESGKQNSEETSNSRAGTPVAATEEPPKFGVARLEPTILSRDPADTAKGAHAVQPSAPAPGGAESSQLSAASNASRGKSSQRGQSASAAQASSARQPDRRNDRDGEALGVRQRGPDGAPLGDGGGTAGHGRSFAEHSVASELQAAQAELVEHAVDALAVRHLFPLNGSVGIAASLFTFLFILATRMGLEASSGASDVVSDPAVAVLVVATFLASVWRLRRSLERRESQRAILKRRRQEKARRLLRKHAAEHEPLADEEMSLRPSPASPGNPPQRRRPEPTQERVSLWGFF